MESWIDHPAVQAAFAPFFCSLMWTALLRRWAWARFALPLAWIVAVSLTAGWPLDAATSSHKLVWIVTAALLACAAAERAGPLASAALAGAVVWMLWRILANKAGLEAIAAAGVAIAFVVVLPASSRRVARSGSVLDATCGILLALATAALCVFAASAWLAQLAVAVAAGLAASLALQLGKATAHDDRMRGTASASACAPIALLATATGELPWAAPLALIAIPWIVLGALSAARYAGFIPSTPRGDIS